MVSLLTQVGVLGFVVEQPPEATVGMLCIHGR